MSADPFEPIVSVIAASTPARILASASAGLARGWRHSRLARHSERIRRFRRLPAPTRVRVTAVFTLCALVASLVVTRIIPRAMRPMVPAVCWYTLLIFGGVVAAMADDLVRAWPTSTLRRLSGRLRIGSVFLLSVFLCSGASAQTPPPKSDIGAAFVDSLKLLMVEHGTRIAFQQKTRRELAGPFIKDYVDSLRWPDRWEDGDAWFVNYIGHPIHGTAAGLIWLDHTTHRDERLSLKAAYWASRGKAAAYTAIRPDAPTVGAREPAAAAKTVIVNASPNL